MELRWPLLGRVEELRSIRAVLRAPAGRGLVLCGPAGIGRTRLLRAAIDEARTAGYRVELVAGTRAAATVPLGALAHLIPEDGPPMRLLRLLAERLCPPGGDRPVLAVDDAHALDDASAALVHQLAFRGAALVVATVRTGEPAPDAVVALWKDDLARRLDVGPLPPATIDALIGQALPGEVSGPARAVLRRLAAGNPRYLSEVLSSAVASRALRESCGFWQWYRGLRGDGYLGELVEERLAACDPSGRAVVEQLALGGPLPLAALESDPGLADAERAGLVEVDVEGVRLAQPLLAEVVRDALPPVRSRAVYRTLAALPLSHVDDRKPVWELASGGSPDPGAALAAAVDALRRYDLDLAERLARAATPPELLAEVLRWQDRATESLAVSADAPGNRARVSRAAALYWGLGRRAEAHAVLRGEDSATAPVRAMTLLFDGRCAEALSTARSALDAGHLPVDARLWAHTAGVLAAANLGQLDLALSLADEGLDLAGRAPGEVLLGATHLRVARAGALLVAGRLAQADADVDEGYRTAAESGEPGLVANWAGLRGFIGQVRGDLIAAGSALREAVALGERRDPVGLRGYHLAVLAGVLAQSGDLDGARAMLARADSYPRGVHPLYAPQVELNRARLAAAAGEPSRAARLALRAASAAAGTGQRCLAAFALYDAARYGAAARVRDRLAELAATVRSDLVGGYADVAGALADGDPAGLERAAARLERLGALLAAAHAAMAASRAYRRTGRPRAVARTREWALTLDLRCRGAGAPWRAVGDTSVLTAREHEIALLAAEPVSSRDIARRLHLSVRTVNNHLHRAYAKLGISGRTQLAAVLREHGPLS